MYKNLKKIAIIMENLEYGGVTTHLIGLLKSKRFRNYEILIITNNSNKAIEQIKKEINYKKIKYLSYYSFNSISSDIFLIKVFLLLFKPLLFLLSFFQMIVIVKKISFDALLANCGGYGNFRDEMAGILACKALNKKNIHLLIHHCYVGQIFWNYLINLINIYIGKISDSLIFVSHATKKSIENNTSLLTYSKKKSVIHNGVLIRNFKKKKLKIFHSKKRIIKIGMLSRIDRYKGQQDLVNAFTKLPKNLKDKMKVFFVGNGDVKNINELKSIIEKENLNNNFKIVNYVKKDSLTIIQNFDLLISLTRDFEGFGYSIAEALYVKTPVIATKVGGIPEYLNNKNATLINPKSSNELIKAISNFYHFESEFKKKTIKGKELIIEKFNSENMSLKFDNLLFKN